MTPSPTSATHPVPLALSSVRCPNLYHDRQSEIVPGRQRPGANKFIVLSGKKGYVLEHELTTWSNIRLPSAGCTRARIYLAREERTGLAGDEEDCSAREEEKPPEVIIKVPPPGCPKLMQYETRAFARLSKPPNRPHSNIIKPIGTGRLDGCEFLVLERLEGSTLYSLRQQCRSLNEMLRLVAEACAGVEHMHGLGLINCDIKPENIMAASSRQPNGAQSNEEQRNEVQRPRARDGPALAIQAVVFDLALAYDSGDSKNWFDGPVGSFGFMAPEMITFSGSPKPTVDIYGFGAVLFELCHKLPGSAGNRESVARMQIEVGASLLPKPVRKIIQVAMEYDPAKRFQTAKEMREQLEDYLATEPADYQLLPVSNVWTPY